MFQIKRLPKDFVVKEISSVDIKNNGQYAYYLLKKMNYTTVDALQILSRKFNIPLKNIGFGGNKDKIAATEQKISIFRGSKNFENINLNNIELKYLGNGKEPISLGDLEGNEFTITIRDLNNIEVKKIKYLENKKIKVPNLYGPQRFGKNNALVGKAIIKRDFKKAVESILENNGIIEDKIKNYLMKNKNNYIEALRLIPLKTRKLFVHSYQSYLFNKMLEKIISEKNFLQKFFSKNIQISLIGFSLEINSIKKKELKKIFEKILDDEKLNPRDFIINQMPELTSEGGFRDLFFQLKFKILESGGDELNKNKQKIQINFILPKSCYATTALESLFQSPRQPH